MKYCPTCGKEMNDNDRFCPVCGHDTGLAPAPKAISSSKNLESYTLIGFIFLLISTIIMGFFLIPLAWNVPFCVHVYRKMQVKQKPSLGVAIASLILSSLIGGIFLILASVEE